MSRGMIINLMRRGELASVKLGASRRIPESALADLIARSTVGGDAA